MRLTVPVQSLITDVIQFAMVCKPFNVFMFTLYCPFPGARQWERPADSAPSLSGPFVPSAGFVGARSGYAFKMGPKGLGYYLDAPSPAAASGALTSQSAADAGSLREASLLQHTCAWVCVVCCGYSLHALPRAAFWSATSASQ